MGEKDAGPVLGDHYDHQFAANILNDKKAVGAEWQKRGTGRAPLGVGIPVCVGAGRYRTKGQLPAGINAG
jgi:hypothetical protein